MPVKFLEDEAIADIAFKVKEKSLELLFETAAITLFRLQTNIDKIEDVKFFEFNLNNKEIDRLLYQFLNEIIYLKDAEFFFPSKVTFQIKKDNLWNISGKFFGETFDETRHTIGNDLKAITMHNFYLKEENNNWEAYILVDI